MLIYKLNQNFDIYTHINISNAKPKQKAEIFTHISTSTGIHQSIDEPRDVFFVFGRVCTIWTDPGFIFPGLTI